VFRNTFLYLILGTPISLLISFVVAYYLDRVRFMHSLHPRALFPAVPHHGRRHGVGVALVLPAGAHRRDQRHPLRLRHPAAAVPALHDAGAACRAGARDLGGARLPDHHLPRGAAGHSEHLLRGRAHRRMSEWRDPEAITLPLLKPTLVFLVVFSSIGFLRIFDQVYNINTNDPGGPLNATKPLVLMIYQTAFSSYEMGYAAAQTVVLFLILLIISLVQLRIMRDR
jgi:multiple sugar transport system permease protein